MGKKSSPTAPAAPDPTATAAAQEQENVGSAIAQANLNRINQVTPQGDLTYSQNGTNADGTPIETQTETLSPAEQQKYDLNNQVAVSLDQLATQGIGTVQQTMGTPFSTAGDQPEATTLNLQGITPAGPVQTGLDYSSLGALPTGSDFGTEATQAQNATYQQAASRLDPQWANNDNDLNSKLAAQGISENSAAYQRAQLQESQAKNDAYTSAQNTAVNTGNQEQQALYGEALSSYQQGATNINDQGEFANTAQGQIFGQNAQEAAVNNANAQTEGTFEDQARQQQIEQDAYLYNLPINEISALLNGGQAATPSFNPVSQVGVAAPDYTGVAENNYSQAMNQFNTQQTAQSQMLGSIFGAAGTAAGAYATGGLSLSDIRFKENIRRIGTLVNGLATYAFNYLGDKAQQFGVMAQEVLGVIPDAVSYGSDGYMRVDYGKVY